jgi:hypothetical protein
MSKTVITRSKATEEEAKVYKKAELFIRKNPILTKQSSVVRKNWCQGFVNGYLYYKHLNPKKSWWQKCLAKIKRN